MHTFPANRRTHNQVFGETTVLHFYSAIPLRYRGDNAGQAIFTRKTVCTTAPQQAIGRCRPAARCTTGIITGLKFPSSSSPCRSRRGPRSQGRLCCGNSPSPPNRRRHLTKIPCQIRISEGTVASLGHRSDTFDHPLGGGATEVDTDQRPPVDISAFEHFAHLAPIQLIAFYNRPAPSAQPLPGAAIHL